MAPRNLVAEDYPDVLSLRGRHETRVVHVIIDAVLVRPDVYRTTLGGLAGGVVRAVSAGRIIGVDLNVFVRPDVIGLPGFR